MLGQHSGDLVPTVDPSQLDLAAGDQAEEQSQRSVFPAAKLLVEPFNRVGRSQRFPLGLWEAEEGEQLVAAFAKAGHRAWAALAPRALEHGVGGSGCVGACGIHDSMEIISNL